MSTTKGQSNQIAGKAAKETLIQEPNPTNEWLNIYSMQLNLMFT